MRTVVPEIVQFIWSKIYHLDKMMVNLKFTVLFIIWNGGQLIS